MFAVCPEAQTPHVYATSMNSLLWRLRQIEAHPFLAVTFHNPDLQACLKLPSQINPNGVIRVPCRRTLGCVAHGGKGFFMAGFGASLLQLQALDEDDLVVLSMHAQAALVLREDLHYFQRDRRFIIGINRFEPGDDEQESSSRRAAVLDFAQVTAVRHRNLQPGEPDSPLCLLAVIFEADDAPSGHITLLFAGGGAIRLDVECIEAQLQDLAPERQTDASGGGAGE